LNRPQNTDLFFSLFSICCELIFGAFCLYSTDTHGARREVGTEESLQQWQVIAFNTKFTPFLVSEMAKPTKKRNAATGNLNFSTPM
jgi:hypothetical protein